MTYHLSKLCLLTLTALALSGCVTLHNGTTKAEKQQAILQMKNETLSQLFKLKPHTRSQLNAAPGYAVFSNANVNLVLASFGGGYGVVKNMSTDQHTYMNMGEVGVGFGFGAKDFRIIMVFDSAEVMNKFIEQGWLFGGQADAAAKASDKGAAVGGEAVVNGITVYQLTETGLALQATVKGTKFWKASDLN
ncbi:lipid-binding SYLF domain-containing protein [Teredinibacter purpureus]|uniref:lipoprotein n=1 Tax=Teredinibacter purpureus TaxID=2731756 RepID=UPI0005F849DB|nr:lipoprotein [Teredinibacter purpureus]